jgi:hypothetical protein
LDLINDICQVENFQDTLDVHGSGNAVDPVTLLHHCTNTKTAVHVPTPGLQAPTLELKEQPGKYI